MRNYSKHALIGLMITTLFVISACGWFGGGADEPEPDAATAQDSASDSEQSDTADNEQAEDDSSSPADASEPGDDDADADSSEEEAPASDDDDSTAASQSDAGSDESSITTDSGLEIITILEGNGEQPQAGDIVQVHYTGTLEDGTQFDSSDGREPIAFPLGRGAVIPGWDEGIALLSKGGKAKLIIPSELGYGARGYGPIPPDATLHFDVELVDFEPGPPGSPDSPQTVPAADYTETDSGLKYFDFEEGEGDTPSDGQTVVVHYTGWLTDGTKFDSSLDRGQPFSFRLGQGSVIAGWDEGIASMKIGGKRQLVIPSDLGYGDAGRGSIPGGATMIFEVELVDFQ